MFRQQFVATSESEEELGHLIVDSKESIQLHTAVEQRTYYE